MTASAEEGNAVLVAVDGSAASTAAVGVASAWAVRRKVGLSIAHVVGSPLIGGAHGPDPLPSAVAAALAAHPGLDVRALGRTGPPDRVLAELARDHSLLVLGSRGHGAIRDAALGSHAVVLAATAPCPVVVVRPGAHRLRPGGPVVAALAGGPRDAPVLEFAFAEAAQRGVPLVVVHSVAHSVDRLLPAGRLVLAALAPGAGPILADEVRSELGPWCARHPQVRVQVEARHGRPAAAVLEAARGAGLLVVGSRGRGVRAGLLLGSVSQGVLHHVHSPLAIVPADFA